MANVRQVKLVCGSEELDLQTAPYDLEAGTWASVGEVLEFGVLVTATSLPLLDRYVADLQRLATRAGLYDRQLLGDAVDIWTKTCDDLSTVAELGATWMVKRIGSMVLGPADASEQASGRYVLRVTVSCQVEDLWRRAAAESVLEASAAPTVRTDGGLTVAAGATLTARRVSYTAAGGLTVRVRWLYSDNDCTFFLAETGANDVKALYLASDHKLYIYDDAGGSASSSALNGTFAANDEVDIVFLWSPGAKMGIWTNGTANGSEASCTLDIADTFQVFAPSTAAQTLMSWQAWPAALTDAQCAGLYAWGRPEAELCAVVAPAADTNTASLYKFYNVPGDASCALRMVLDGAAQDYAMVKAGLRPLRIPTTVAWECEDGTNGTNVADAVDATASAGYVAQFTPSDTNSATRSTLALCANPADVAAMAGEWRLYLACKDNAAGTGVNLVKWRMTIAGQAEDYSDEFSAAAVSTYSLVDLGTVRIPPGQWPDESISASTDVVGGTYLALELAVRNTAGSGGGTFDMDAVYLVPAELEGTLMGTFDVSAWYEVIDFTGEWASAIGAADYRSMEFGAWAAWVGDRLELTPRAGNGGALMVFWFRNAIEQWYAGDTCDVFLYCEPRWRR